MLGVMQVIEKLLGIWFILSGVVPIVKLLFDRSVYGGEEECEVCQKYIEEKYGVKTKVYVTDKLLKKGIAFVSRSGIFVYRELLEPEYRDVLFAVLDHEVEHLKSHDLLKIAGLRTITYLITGLVFFKYGLLRGFIAAIVLGAVYKLYEMNREVSLLMELKKKDPETFERVYELVNSL